MIVAAVIGISTAKDRPSGGAAAGDFPSHRAPRAEHAAMSTILLLLASNLFMTTAWYWHLKPGSTAQPLLVIILVSWLFALPEYALAVPANRLGSATLGGPFSSWQLKVIQEGVGLLVFLAFVLVYLRELPRWQDLLGISLILGGLVVALWQRGLPAA